MEIEKGGQKHDVKNTRMMDFRQNKANSISRTMGAVSANCGMIFVPQQAENPIS